MTTTPEFHNKPAAHRLATGSTPDNGAGDDDLIAALLMRMWALASGHVLPDGPPDQLSEEQLIEFWADDMYLRSGRHASSSPALEAARDDNAVVCLEASRTGR